MLPVLSANGSSGYNISRSVRLRSSASAYFSRTFGTPTSNTKYTISLWAKRGKLGAAQYFGLSYNGASDYTSFYFDANDKLNFTGDSATAGRTFGLTTAAVFRDPSAWYHVVVVFDSANATVANRCIIYVNGVSQTLTGTTVPSGIPTYFNTNGIAVNIGALNGSNFLDGYLTEINFIDGQALTPSSFGSTNAVTGVWQPAKYTGTYGTNGFYLNFSDNSAATAAAIGKDYSGNGNNWTPNNISVTAGTTYDSMLDVPTPYADGGNGRGNYATWNPLSQTYSLSNKGVASDGNLKYTVPAGNTSQDYIEATIPCSQKVYVELTLGVVGTGGTFVYSGGIAQTVGTNWTYNSVAFVNALN